MALFVGMTERAARTDLVFVFVILVTCDVSRWAAN